MTKLTLQIEGMSCGHCLQAVRQALDGLRGVAAASVELGRAELEYEAAAIGPDAIIAAVERAGYRARVSGSAAG